MVMIVIARQMRHGPLVAVAETFPIGIAIVVPHVRMAIFIVIIGIRVAMMFEVVAGCFDAVVKALPLHIAILLRGLIPIGVILRCDGHGRTRRGGVGLHHGRAHPEQRKRER